MDNTSLRKIQIDQETYVCDDGVTFRKKDMEKYLSYFMEMKEKGKIKGEYADPVWIGNSDIKRTNIDFTFNVYGYRANAYKALKIPESDIKDMLRCYALFICGEFIFKTISDKIGYIKEFLTLPLPLGDETEVNGMWKATVAEFLSFIGIPEKQKNALLSGIRSKAVGKSKPRELAPFINYLAVANELSDMYAGTLCEEEFIFWFPLYFWSHVTFVLPLRATEMLVTPFDCIIRKEGKVYISVRRTLIKGGGKTVSYDVDKDYGLFNYEIPDTQVVRNIERYQELTKAHKRRFLFTYGPKFVNGIFSLRGFNDLLKYFVETHLQGNHKYDYSRYASGIEEFEMITAGDSRPIALANLFYQNVNLEICRQLANHMYASMTIWYCMNVAKTVEASSIMELQRKLNYGYSRVQEYEESYGMQVPVKVRSFCQSPKRPLITGNIDDCRDYPEDCLGCRYYKPSKEELERALSDRKEDLDKASKAVFACVAIKDKNRDEDFEKIFLDEHTAITRYRTACDKKTKEVFKEWQRHHHIQTISC